VPNAFVSHRGADQAEAEALADQIRRSGHKVWLDTWDIKVGDSIVERINEGLEAAQYLVLCYSSSGVMARWMSREWMSTLARQLDGTGVKLIPVRLTGGDPPAVLADVKYVDLMKDWRAGVSQLLTAMT